MSYKQEIVDSLNKEICRIQQDMLNRQKYYNRNPKRQAENNAALIRFTQMTKALKNVPDNLADYIYMLGYRRGERDF